MQFDHMLQTILLIPRFPRKKSKGHALLKFHKQICCVRRSKIKKPALNILLTNICTKKDLFKVGLIDQSAYESKMQ